MMASDPVRTSKWWHWAFDGAVSQVDVYVERGRRIRSRLWWVLLGSEEEVVASSIDLFRL